jgi:hypothetical protein
MLQLHEMLLYSTVLSVIKYLPVQYRVRILKSVLWIRGDFVRIPILLFRSIRILPFTPIQLNSWQDFKKITFKIFIRNYYLYRYVIKDELNPFKEKLAKVYSDFQVKNIRTGPGTIIPELNPDPT